MKTITKFLLLSVAIFLGCSKPKDGKPGKDGNANVKAYNFTIYSTSWTLGTSTWYNDYTIYTGSDDCVMGYYSSDYIYWIPMPFTINDNEIYFAKTTSLIKTIVRSASGSTSISNPGLLYVKYIVIPPAIKKPNVNHANYAEVKQAYDLK